MLKVISIKRVTDAVYQYRPGYPDTDLNTPSLIIPATHEVTLQCKDGSVCVGVTGNTTDLTKMTGGGVNFYPLTTPHHVIDLKMLKEHLTACQQNGQHPSVATKELMQTLLEYAPHIRFTTEAAEYICRTKDAAVCKVVNINEIVSNKIF